MKQLRTDIPINLWHALQLFTMNALQKYQVNQSVYKIEMQRLMRDNSSTLWKDDYYCSMKNNSRARKLCWNLHLIQITNISINKIFIQISKMLINIVSNCVKYGHKHSRYSWNIKLCFEIFFSLFYCCQQNWLKSQGWKELRIIKDKILESALKVIKFLSFFKDMKFCSF